MHCEALNQLNKLLFSIIPTPFYILLQIALLTRDFIFSISEFFPPLGISPRERKKHQPEFLSKKKKKRRNALVISSTSEKIAELQRGAGVSQNTRVMM